MPTLAAGDVISVDDLTRGKRFLASQTEKELNMANKSGKGVPLRDFAMGSYDPNTGRTHSSINTAGNPGNHCGSADNQVPSISGRDKSGAGDPGRNKSRGSSLP